MICWHTTGSNDALTSRCNMTREKKARKNARRAEHRMVTPTQTSGTGRRILGGIQRRVPFDGSCFWMTSRVVCQYRTLLQSSRFLSFYFLFDALCRFVVDTNDVGTFALAPWFLLTMVKKALRYWETMLVSPPCHQSRSSSW